MTRIYFDNAATTALDPEVLEVMMPYLTEKFGNPSSVYSYGRESKMAIEKARKAVARILNCSPGEVFFTSGGTESSNTAICAAVEDLGCKHIITSPIEHHATLHTVESLVRSGQATVHYLRLTPNGHVDLDHLESLLKENSPSLVTLMHANNEIGNLLKIKTVAGLCEKYRAWFHSDMVQTIGHYPVDLKSCALHFASSAGHKFHGPKGVGMLYVREDTSIQPFIKGGAQERNMRAGTENIYGIVGYAKALELAMQRYEQDSRHITALKKYFITQIKSEFPQARLNGDPEGSSLYTVLNVAFPKTEKTEMLLMNMDMAGICVSGGSACSSGAASVSHVIEAIYNGASNGLVPLRFSFCRHNTQAEADQVVATLKQLV